MRAFIVFILIILLGGAASYWLPWWTIAPVAFLVVLVLHQRPFAAFLTALLAGWILWAGWTFFTDLQNDHILSQRMSLLIFRQASPILAIAAGAIPAALVSGLAALSASFLRTPRRKRSANVSFSSYYQSR